MATIGIINGVLEDTAKEISFSQLKSLLTGLDRSVLTTVQAFQITAGTGTLERFDDGVWSPVPSEADTTYWISKTGVYSYFNTTSTPINDTNLNLRWTPALNANAHDKDGVTSDGIVVDNTGPITAFSITAATAIGGTPIVVENTPLTLNVTADVIALNDAPVLSAVDNFAGHAGIGKAFKVQDLLGHSADLHDVDNFDNELTFKIDTIITQTVSGETLKDVGTLKYGTTVYEGSSVQPSTPGAVGYAADPNNQNALIWYIAGDVVEPDTLLGPNDVLIWTPDVDQDDASNVISFTVTAWDGQLESWEGEGSYTGQVNPIDVRFDVATPNAVDDNVTIIEDTTRTILASELFNLGDSALTNRDFGAGETLKIREVHLKYETVQPTLLNGYKSSDEAGNTVWLDTYGNVVFQPAPNSQTTDSVALDHVDAPQFTYVIETPSYANIATNDLPASMTGTVTVGITAVDDAPTADIVNTGTVVIVDASHTATGSETLDGVPLIGTPGVSINDKIRSITVDDVDTAEIIVHLSVINGALSATGTLGVAGVTPMNDGAELTISGTIVGVQAALDTLHYYQDGTADDDLFITVSSGSGTVLTTEEQHISLQIGPDDNAPPAFDFQTNETLYNLTHETYENLTDPLFILNTGTNVLGTRTDLAPFKSTDVNVSLDGDDLVLTHTTIDGTSNTLTLVNYIDDLKGDKIQFLDGSTLQYENGLNNEGVETKSVLYGTANPDHLILNFSFSRAGGTLKGYMDADKLEGSLGRDVLYGGSDNDTIIGYDGNDYLNGGDGADTFVFAATFSNGSDVIADYSNGDLIELKDAQAITVSQSGSDTLITYVDNNYTNSIRLMGVSSTSTNNVDGVITSAITLDNFAYTTGHAPVISSILVGTGGADSIVAGPGSDTIIGGLGADSIDLGDADGDVVIKYNTSHESTLDSVDRISHLVLNAGDADKIDLPVAGVNTIVASQPIAALDEKSINDLLNSVNGSVNNEGAITPNTLKFSGSVATPSLDVAVLTTDNKTFLAIDLDGNGAFSAATDMLIEITGATNGTAGIPANITIGSFI